MNINPGNGIGIQDRSVFSSRIAPEKVKTETGKDETQTTTWGSEVIANEAQTGDKEPGVLRLLQEGHFRGVADVRLRINFHDDIAAMEDEQTRQIIRDGIPAILGDVNSRLDGFIEEGQIEETALGRISEFRETFDLSIQEIMDGFQTGNESQPQNAVSFLEAGFDQLVSDVKSVLTGATEPDADLSGEGLTAVIEEGADVQETSEEVAGDPGTEPEVPSAVDQFFADLINSFKQGLQELESALNDSEVLPPLSEANGKGGAYQKFLTIYNELRGGIADEVTLTQVDESV